ncbi:winged helix-turn-helix domain-containing protein [Ramlibacter tataouinensis]|uniref:winged helix-turn-helix domain-containing protein n=1 Tax=Ramlibacter tataouinensis TaxID=94132 RepID=UPI001314C723|nr:transcriptional regulator [Ramlibacter tataouinensis]
MARSQAGSGTPRRVAFGDFVLDESRATLLHRGREIHLRPKSWELLCYLARRPGQLVAREELMHVLWPSVVVVDDSINQCVVEVRRALDDGGRQLLQTVPRRGLRLSADLAELPCWPVHTTSAPAAMAVDSLDQAWEALRSLAGVEAVADARRRFESEYMLGRRRVEALNGIALSHVIDVLNRWSASPQWQVGIAREASKEALRLSPRNALAHHARAHVAMLEGFHFEAWAGFRRAVELEPRLAHAHLRMAIIQLELGNAHSARPHIAQALACSRSPKLEAQAQFVRGMVDFHVGREQDSSTHFRAALELNPAAGLAHQWLAVIEALQGREELARQHLEAFGRLSGAHSCASLKATERSRNPVFWQQRTRFYEGLRRAGLPA